MPLADHFCSVRAHGVAKRKSIGGEIKVSGMILEIGERILHIPVNRGAAQNYGTVAGSEGG
jgi:hypothetical protein